MTDFSVSIGDQRFDPRDQAESNEPAPSGAGLSLWIVQFLHTLARDERSALIADFGLRLTGYLANFAYVETLSGDVAAQVRSHPAVRAVVPYRPELKFRDSTRQTPARDDEPGTALFSAVLAAGVDFGSVISQLEAHGAVDVISTPGAPAEFPQDIMFFAPPGALDELSMIPGVQWIEPAPQFVSDDMSRVSDMIFGPDGPGRADVHGLLDGSGQIIGLLDDGPVDMAHDFFVDPLTASPGPAHRKVLQLRNACRQAIGPHATFVAGCAAGDDVNATGQAPWRGGAWAARLVLGNRNDLAAFDSGRGAPMHAMGDELSVAAAAGATVHSNSYHVVPAGPQPPPGAPYDIVCAAVDRFCWLNEEQLVLGSSGNAGETQGAPGTAKNAICVAAATADATSPQLGDGASGPTADGRVKPDLTMVGCGVQSAIAGTKADVGPRSPCATSYAAPITAAAAALVRQYFLAGWYPAGRPASGEALVPTGALIKAVLVNGTAAMASGDAYPSQAAGWGLLQVDRALYFDGGVRRLQVFSAGNAAGLATGESAVHDIDVADGTIPLAVTLAWMDPPGLPGAANPVVNNLDLEVQDPTGAVLRGNVFAGAWSAAGGEADERNNVERVVIEHPAAGTWHITVRAAAVNVGAPGQGYALAVSGGITVPAVSHTRR